MLSIYEKDLKEASTSRGPERTDFEMLQRLETSYKSYKVYLRDDENLKSMCNSCECYCGNEHDYEECRHKECFCFYLAYKYLYWALSYDPNL